MSDVYAQRLAAVSLEKAMTEFDLKDAQADVERLAAIAQRVDQALPRLDQAVTALGASGQHEFAHLILSIKSDLMGLEP